MADDNKQAAQDAFRENPKFLQPHEYVEDKHGVCAFCGEGMLHVWYELFQALEKAETELADLQRQRPRPKGVS